MYKVTKAAVDIVRGLTGSDDGLKSLSIYAKTVLPSLSRFLSANKVLFVLYFLIFSSFEKYEPFQLHIFSSSLNSLKS